MSRYSIVLLLLAAVALNLASNVPASAQTPEDEVRAVIDHLFDGMRAGDSTAVRSVFHDQATLGSTFTDPNGAPQYRAGSVDDFVAAVGSPHDDIWDERIWDVQINVRDNLATAWMDYAFYAGENFSHCGVNTFQLIRTDEGWKTIHLIDTRRREGCEMPE